MGDKSPGPPYDVDMDREELSILGWNLREDVVDAFDRMVELRRDFHRHPELGFQERRTSAVVESHLKAAGLAPRRLGGTGVVAKIEGRAPGPRRLIRADMDALPVTEQTGASYCSVHEGVMHACGHDAHTAAALVTAELLAREGLETGEVVFVFQPAEEGVGGAQSLIEEGLLDEPVDAAVAFHVWTGFQTGRVFAPDGPVMASVDGFELVVTGRGTHAATPEDGIDPVFVAAQIISAAQGFVSRTVSPFEPAVLSFTAVHAGEAFNVIPQVAGVLGTIRTYDEKVRAGIKTRLMDLAEGVARAFGAKVEYRSLVEHISVQNDDQVASKMRRLAREVAGAEAVISPRPLMVGEDFGEIIDIVPGAMVVVGCRDAQRGSVFPHHHPCFDIDERAMALISELMLRFVRE